MRDVIQKIVEESIETEFLAYCVKKRLELGPVTQDLTKYLFDEFESLNHFANSFYGMEKEDIEESERAQTLIDSLLSFAKEFNIYLTMDDLSKVSNEGGNYHEEGEFFNPPKKTRNPALEGVNMFDMLIDSWKE